MSIQDLGAIGEFVSSVVVFATLVYLAIQVRQSNRLSRAHARQTMMQVIQSELYKLMDNPHLVSAMASKPKTEEDRAKLAIWLTAALRQREFDWMQYKDGVIDEETYRAYVGVISIVLGTEHTRRWWKAVGSTAFNPDFVAEVNRLLEHSPHTDWFSRTLNWE